MELWSCALDLGQIWCGIGFFFLSLMLWRSEIEVMGMSIDVSFNKAMVREILIPAGPLLTGCCGGGRISGSVEDGVSRKDCKTALWSFCTLARVCCCDIGPVGRPL
jgi:hypothetical protein